ncbi:MAG: TIGR03792 family protein [Pseudomonadota bacterium]
MTRHVGIPTHRKAGAVLINAAPTDPLHRVARGVAGHVDLRDIPACWKSQAPAPPGLPPLAIWSLSPSADWWRSASETRADLIHRDAALGVTGGKYTLKVEDWGLVIEHLTVSVPANRHAEFLSADAAVWTNVLAAQPGYLGKETWVEADDATRVHLIIRWASRAEWKAVPEALLAQTDARMAQIFGQPVPVLSCVDLDVLG